MNIINKDMKKLSFIKQHNDRKLKSKKGDMSTIIV